MLDFSIGELGLIGAVALVVLGPERLPRLARTVGAWLGKAQRYVNQVKSDINREIELSELKRLEEEARSAARSVENSFRDAVDGAHGAVGDAVGTAKSTLSDAMTPMMIPTETQLEPTDSWHPPNFSRRYRPGPSVDELADELARLKRRLSMPGAPATARSKYAARARFNRPRIRR